MNDRKWWSGNMEPHYIRSFHMVPRKTLRRMPRSTRRDLVEMSKQKGAVR
jgi:hypothetical protein